MDYVDQIVGAQINARRVAMAMSLQQLSDKTGISTQKIQAYEAARSRVSASQLAKLATAMEVEAAFFFFLPDETAKPMIDEALGPDRGDQAAMEMTTRAERMMKAYAAIKNKGLREAALTIIEEIARIDDARSMSDERLSRSGS